VRAADVWRICQDVAVDSSSLSGWPPQRYAQEGNAFVMRSMKLIHQREISTQQALAAQTWISEFRRGIVSVREIRILNDLEKQTVPVVSATQEWVHIGRDYRIRPAPPSLVAALNIFATEAKIVLPQYHPITNAAEYHFNFHVWHTWMDALGHVNHPTYVDWLDEAFSRVLAQHQIDPVEVVAVAEELHYRASAVANDQVQVTLQLIGATELGELVIRHRIVNTDTQKLFVDGIIIRRLTTQEATVRFSSLWNEK